MWSYSGHIFGLENVTRILRLFLGLLFWELLVKTRLMGDGLGVGDFEVHD